ncbi:hypothetical protein V8C34DRAFT_269198 [Trichoderma compactum]
MCLSVCRSGKMLLVGCLMLSLASSDLVNRRESWVASSTAHGSVKSGADVFQSSPSPLVNAYSDVLFKWRLELTRSLEVDDEGGVDCYC